MDTDACADRPCFPGVRCTDVEATQIQLYPKGFICGNCPIGMEGDGEICTGMWSNSKL